MSDVGILGPDAVRGNPAAMRVVATYLRDTARHIEFVRGSLGDHVLPRSWEGAAADAFRALLSHTPEDLAKAGRSYAHASDTVTRYAAELQRAHDLAQVLADRLADALRRAATADGVVRAGHQAVDTARRAYSREKDPTARARALHLLNDRLRAASNADRARAGIQGEIDAIRRQAADNRHALDGVANWTREELHQASREGIRNSASTLLHRYGQPLAHGAVAVGTGLVHAAGHILYSALTLPDAVLAFVLDPSAKNFSALLDHVSAALTVVGLVAAVVVGVFTGGAGAVVVLGLLTEVQAGVAALKLGVDAGRALSGDKSVTALDLGLDTLGVLLALEGAQSFSAAHDAEQGVMSALKPVEAFDPAAGDIRREFARGILKDEAANVPKDAGKSVLEGGFSDWVTNSAGEQDDDPALEHHPILDYGVNHLRSELTRIKHTILVPAVRALPSPVIPIPLAQEAR